MWMCLLLFQHRTSEKIHHPLLLGSSTRFVDYIPIPKSVSCPTTNLQISRASPHPTVDIHQPTGGPGQDTMKPGLVILVLSLTLVPACAIFGWWFSKKWLQRQVDEYDRARLTADALNAQAEAQRGTSNNDNA